MAEVIFNDNLDTYDQDIINNMNKIKIMVNGTINALCQTYMPLYIFEKVENYAVQKLSPIYKVLNSLDLWEASEYEYGTIFDSPGATVLRGITYDTHIRITWNDIVMYSGTFDALYNKEVHDFSITLHSHTKLMGTTTDKLLTNYEKHNGVGSYSLYTNMEFDMNLLRFHLSEYHDDEHDISYSAITDIEYDSEFLVDKLKEHSKIKNECYFIIEDELPIPKEALLNESKESL